MFYFIISKKKFIQLFFILFILLLSILYIISTPNNETIKENYLSIEASSNYIKWIDFTATNKILTDTSSIHIKSYTEDYKIKYNWIELLAYLSSKYYGKLGAYKKSDLNTLIAELDSGKSIKELSTNMDNYDFYYTSLDAILGDYIGYYNVKNLETGEYETKYGLKVFSPIAQGYHFSHSNDFGNSRSYGYKRVHLGNDLLGNIGTPIIAIESGYVEACGWNQYGGWRIGIRSFDGLRYYYYAHLKKDTPYHSLIKEGSIVTAGDVIGYLGMTGYSTTENVNNINTPHLHLGVQIIFDPSQKDGVNQIWINLYELVEFLRKQSSAIYYDKETKDYYRKFDMIDPLIPE